MTPEELIEQANQLVAESDQLVVQAVNQAIEASNAFAAGKFDEYWKSVGEAAQQRINDRYEYAKSQQAEPRTEDGARVDAGGR